jgi:alkaline phosphatase D
MNGDDERREGAAAISRRELLKSSAAIGAATLPLGAGCSSDKDGGDEPPGELGPETMFLHGVASGDPLPDAVILWTRVSPQREGSVTVQWTLASDPSLRDVAASGSFDTSEERDFTVKVDATGLTPATTYYYRFDSLRRSSPVGRTRTAPTGAVTRLRFGVVSCASYAHGYFHAYRAVAERTDLDAVLHLGDYIYEYGTGQYGNVREYEPPNEIITLEDYRMRYSLYRRDPDLAEAHRQHPFIAIWDDHETADNSWKDGAFNHNPEQGEGLWADRKAAGIRAYMEWMPIRESEPNRIFRKLSFGDLADLVLLDTRLWARDETTEGLVVPPPPDDPNRTLLGDDQAAWLEQQLGGSQAQWKLIGQQVMVANIVLEPGVRIVNIDQWHGYPASRTRFLEFLRDSGVENVVVLTGDIHSSWAADLVLDPSLYDNGLGSIAVEMVTPGITSPGLPKDAFDLLYQQAIIYNPHIRWVDPSLRGYMVLDVTPERTQSAWFLFESIEQTATPGEQVGAVWAVRAGERMLTEEAAPAAARTDAPLPAPGA